MDLTFKPASFQGKRKIKRTPTSGRFRGCKESLIINIEIGPVDNLAFEGGIIHTYPCDDDVRTSAHKHESNTKKSESLLGMIKSYHTLQNRIP